MTTTVPQSAPRHNFYPEFIIDQYEKVMLRNKYAGVDQGVPNKAKKTTAPAGPPKASSTMCLTSSLERTYKWPE